MTKLHARSVSSVLVLLTACWSLPAAAQPLDAAELEARDAEAKRACDAGQVQEGERLLTDLFRRTDDGTYLFNLGRCYQQNGQNDKALPQFRAYLLRSDVDPAAAARARASIAELDPPPAPAATAPARPPLVTPVTSITAEAPPSPGRTLRIAALVSGGLGLAGVAAGAYYAQQTNKLEREKREALERPDQTDEWFVNQDRKGEQAERRQWMFLGAGVAALAAGGVLYYLGARAGEEQGPLQSARALPLALPGVVGAVIAGRF